MRSFRRSLAILLPVLAIALALALGAGSGALAGSDSGKDASAENENAESPYRKPTDEELRARLTPIQYDVTQNDATERPFRNEYWDIKDAGIYVDLVSGEPLFSSSDKFKSGTGWPSFTRPLEPEHVVLHEDRSLWMTRTEVRSRHGDSHLGHVFPDGPPPTGQRFCMNSASLRFVPVAELESEGYGQYLPLFAQEAPEQP